MAFEDPYVVTTYDNESQVSMDMQTRARLEALVKEASQYRTKSAGMHGCLPRIDQFQIDD